MISNKAPSSSVSGTLAGGIQDVSAILPLIGTEQCEKHVGSALMGGYLYAAATPLSIFGSLGIVKSGMAILISSISISFPTFLFSFDEQLSIEYCGTHKWLGGRMLKDAGFELAGTVAPLIGMDDQRFKAESRLINMLEENHIESTQDISVHWKSRRWNTILVVWTILAAMLSSTPYVALLLGPRSWKPNQIHLPWLYPALRIVGSCFTTVACQYIIQSRVVSLMKSRIIFMVVDQRLKEIYKDGFDIWRQNTDIQWDKSLPAEQCIWSLERYILSIGSLGSEDPNHISMPIDIASPTAPPPLAALSSVEPGSISFSIDELHRLQQKHFQTPIHNTIYMVVLWLLLGLSLPSTVAGYVGCFTLVSATPSPGNGPVVWLGLEAALSILRIVVWALNPRFDEDTEISLVLNLSEHRPMITTHDYNPYIASSNSQAKKSFSLVPEHEFLKWITPYTGPLNPFEKLDDNITLFFTLAPDYREITTSLAQYTSWTAMSAGEGTANFKRDSDGTASGISPPPLAFIDDPAFFDELYDPSPNGYDEIPLIRPSYSSKPEFCCLLMTVFDFNMQVGVTFVASKKTFDYFDVNVQYNPISRQMEATIQSEKRGLGDHPWRPRSGIIEYGSSTLFESLEIYLQYVIDGFRDREMIEKIASTATLPSKWDLSRITPPSTNRPPVAERNQEGRDSSTIPPQMIEMLLRLTAEDYLYLDRGYEHQLRTGLIAKWRRWTVMDMSNIRSESRYDCIEALTSRSSTSLSTKAKWELIELDRQLVWGWAMRESALLMLVLELEDILRTKMNACTREVVQARQDRSLGMWMMSEFESGRRKRMQKERESARARLQTAMKDAKAEADSEGRPWHEDESQLHFAPRWMKAIEHVDRLWSVGISIDNLGHCNLSDSMEKEWKTLTKDPSYYKSIYQHRYDFLEPLKKRLSHEQWCLSYKYEEQIMKETLAKIRSVTIQHDGVWYDLAMAYRYPDPDRLATAKFASASIQNSSTRGRACAAVVYDAWSCDRDTLCQIIAKSTTRSVVNVDPKDVGYIPPNDHLLFLSCWKEPGTMHMAEEPTFVRQNRERWWEQQTSNSSMFFFTPRRTVPGFCVGQGKGDAIARIFVLLTSSSSTIRISVIHSGSNALNVFVLENGSELGCISDIPSQPTFQFHQFPPIVLHSSGKHELELVPEFLVSEQGNTNLNGYYLRDVFVKFLDETSVFESTDGTLLA